MEGLGDTAPTKRAGTTMHLFEELIQTGAEFSLNALNEAYGRVVAALEESSGTPLVRSLQMLQLQKAVLAVGMFSMFDASLKDGLGAEDGFKEATARLEAIGEVQLGEAFADLVRAINVLKHGHGRSYNALVAKADFLPFRIKRPDEGFFFEGDVSEVATLVEVNDDFVRLCAKTIQQVSAALK